jgi:enoyl-CoA hydratase/carnithine racemase
MSGDILATEHNGVLRVTLDRPGKRNRLARDAELFAQAWGHADHWAGAKNVLQKEASR